MVSAVRLATTDDVDEVLDLVADYCEADGHPFVARVVRRPLEELIASDRWGRVFVVDDGDVIVGYAVLTWGFGLEAGGLEAVLDEIYVDRKGLGFGSQLIEAVVDDCRARGVRRIFLETEAPNDGARRLYARHGFDADDSVWMERWLADPMS